MLCQFGLLSGLSDFCALLHHIYAVIRPGEAEHNPVTAYSRNYLIRTYRLLL